MFKVDGTLRAKIGQGSEGGDISFYEDTGNTAKFFWDASAESLGIGTSSPAALLHLESAEPVIRIKDSDGSAYHQIFASTNDLIIDADRPNNASSNLIFRNDGSEAMRLSSDGSCRWTPDGTTQDMTLDASGNLMVGGTDTFPHDNAATSGTAIGASGYLSIARSGGISGYFNRMSSDGDILQFRKDGTTVGSIGTQGDDLVIGTGAAAIRFRDSVPELQPWNVTTNVLVNGTIDIGGDGRSFKDLYLSGGVYLGGTVAANKLDDYEEGDYEATLTCSSGTITLNSAINRMAYTKIGRQVTITGRVNISSISSPSGGVVMNLPFTSAGSLTDQADNALFNVAMHDINIPSDAVQLFGEVGASSNTVAVFYVVSNSAWPSFNANNFDGSGNEYIYINGTYLTD